MGWKRTTPALRKANSQVANSYSVTDQAMALTMQAKTPLSTGANPAYGDGQQFSPGQPLQPMHSNNPPWQNQFRVGRNLVITPRSEDPRLTPFQVLRTLADSHDIVSICIKMMIDQVTGDEHDIVPAIKEDKTDYSKDITAVKAFFYRPDKVHLFSDWIKMYLNDVLPIDAGTIYKRRTRAGKLYSLEVCDGATFKPLIDAYGRVPQPPNAAYQQIIYGVPYGSGNGAAGFTTNDIVYRPRYPRTWTTYGFAPTEQLLMKINIMLRRDDFHLRYYTKGALPDAGLFQVDAEWTPDQLDQYQQLWNDVMSGNIDERLSMRFVPKGTYTATKEFKFDPKVDEWIARLVAVTFGVNPQAFIMMMNRATGEMQDSQQTDIGLGPLETFLEELFTDIIQNDLGYPHLRFKYIDEKKEDAKVTVDRNMQYVTRGLRSIDEIRAVDGLAPTTDLEDGVPPYVLLGNDIVFITKDYIEAKQKAQLDALAMGVTQAGNAQNNQQAANNAVQVEDVPDKKGAKKAIVDELKQYEKFAINRLKKKTKREFLTDVIPDDIHKSIKIKIDRLETADQIKELFKAAKKKIILLETLKRKLQDDFGDELDDSGETFMDVAETAGTAEKLLNILTDYDFFVGFGIDKTADTVKDISQAGWQYGKDTLETMTGNEIELQFDSHIAAEQAKDHALDLVKDLNVSSRDMLKATISDSVANEEPWEVLKDKLKNNYAFSDSRAETIARTESGTLYNQGFVQAGIDSGLVDGVLVEDGDGDSECAEADGQTWDLDDAMANPLAHPNCVRSFTYVLKGEDGDDEDSD